MDGGDRKASARWFKRFVDKLGEEAAVDVNEMFAGACPCRIEDEAVRRAREIHERAVDVKAFVAEMSRQKVIGRRIWYDEADATIYITKLYARDCGGGYPGGEGLIAGRCHCDYVNASTEQIPMGYCHCAAGFFRPMFAPLFGHDVVIEPVETVLSGGEECTFAVRLQGV